MDLQDWEMSEGDAYELLVREGVAVEGHHIFSAGAHSGVKMIFRNLDPDNKQEVRDRLDRALAFRILAELAGFDFDCITGPDTGGLKMARRLAPILSEALGHEIKVISNRKLDNKEFVVEEGDWQQTALRVLFVEDVATSGDSLRRLMRAFELYVIVIYGIFVYVSREGQTAESLGVPCFAALVNRQMPSHQVQKGEVCPQCEAGEPISPHH